MKPITPTILVILFLFLLLLAPATARNSNPAKDPAPTFTHWQELMAQGSSALHKLEFAEAERAFNDALQEALKQSDRTAYGQRYLSYSRLSEVFDEQAKYSDEESLCRDWIAKCPGTDAYQALSDVLEKLKRPDEAKAIRKDHPLPTTTQFNETMTWMTKKVQPAVRRHWKPVDVYWKKVANLDWHAPSLTNHESNSANIIFCWFDKNMPVSAFVEQSSLDKHMDRHDLTIIEQVALDPPPVVRVPFVVAFTFDYNAAPWKDHGGSGMAPALLIRQQKKYQSLRHRMQWQEEHLGEGHIAVAQSLCDAADIFHAMDSDDNEIKANTKALEIFDSNKVIIYRTYLATTHLADLLLKQKRYSEAAPYFHRSVQLADYIFSPDSGEVAYRKAQLEKLPPQFRPAATPASKTDSDQPKVTE